MRSRRRRFGSGRCLRQARSPARRAVKRLDYLRARGDSSRPSVGRRVTACGKCPPGCPKARSLSSSAREIGRASQPSPPTAGSPNDERIVLAELGSAARRRWWSARAADGRTGSPRPAVALSPPGQGDRALGGDSPLHLHRARARGDLAARWTVCEAGAGAGRHQRAHQWPNESSAGDASWRACSPRCATTERRQTPSCSGLRLNAADPEDFPTSWWTRRPACGIEKGRRSRARSLARGC